MALAAACQASQRGTLASRRGTWQGSGMATSSPSAGGVLIALGAIVGAGIGVAMSQPTVGFLAGLGLGAVLALAMWWRSRHGR